MYKLVLLKTGDLLPLATSEAFTETGTGGVLDLESQSITMVLDDYRPQDEEAFNGMANFRIALCKTFLMVSVSFSRFSFDLIWSPVIAKLADEDITPVDASMGHMLFNFILADSDHVIRAIRTATISPNCGAALARAQNALMQRDIEDLDVHAEIALLYADHPQGFPHTFFDEICALGD